MYIILKFYVFFLCFFSLSLFHFSPCLFPPSSMMQGFCPIFPFDPWTIVHGKPILHCTYSNSHSLRSYLYCLQLQFQSATAVHNGSPCLCQPGVELVGLSGKKLAKVLVASLPLELFVNLRVSVL